MTSFLLYFAIAPENVDIITSFSEIFELADYKVLVAIDNYLGKVDNSKWNQTIEQLKAFFRLNVRTSNLLPNIELLRFAQRTNRIVVLIGETIQVEILSNGEKIIG